MSISDQPPRDPATGRFAAGRSGNARGRPRRGNAVNKAILNALAAPVIIEDADGNSRRLTKLAAAARQVADRGVAGDARDGRLALDLALRAEERITETAPRRAPKRLAPTDEAILARLIERLRAMAADGKADG